MCITIYTLYSCNCRYPKTVTPCPMMETALDLVDHDGIPESDPRVQRLEDQCDDKAATRYEAQTDTCEPCLAAIAAVGMQAWSVAREKRDREVDDRWFLEMERDDRAVMAKEEEKKKKKKKQKLERSLRCKRRMRRRRRGSVEVDALEGKSIGEGDTVVEEGSAKTGNVVTAMGAMRFLRDDDLVDASSSPPSGAQVGKGTTPTPEDDVMIYQDASDDDDDDDDAPAAAVDPGDLRNALREVLGIHGNIQGSHGKENVYDADDDMLDVQDGADAGASRSTAPSPGRER